MTRMMKKMEAMKHALEANSCIRPFPILCFNLTKKKNMNRTIFWKFFLWCRVAKFDRIFQSRFSRTARRIHKFNYN